MLFFIRRIASNELLYFLVSTREGRGELIILHAALIRPLTPHPYKAGADTPCFAEPCTRGVGGGEGVDC